MKLFKRAKSEPLPALLTTPWCFPAAPELCKAIDRLRQEVIAQLNLYDVTVDLLEQADELSHAWALLHEEEQAFVHTHRAATVATYSDSAMHKLQSAYSSADYTYSYVDELRQKGLYCPYDALYAYTLNYSLDCVQPIHDFFTFRALREASYAKGRNADRLLSHFFDWHYPAKLKLILPLAEPLFEARATLAKANDDLLTQVTARREQIARYALLDDASREALSTDFQLVLARYRSQARREELAMSSAITAAVSSGVNKALKI